MQLTSGYEARRARIEVVPLLDVVFLLLVFFVYAMLSMTIHRGVHVTLPSASGTTEPIERFVITLTEDNKLMIEGDAVDMEKAVRITLTRLKPAGRKVLIRGDQRADLGIAIELLSRLRSAGVDAVSFLVQSDSGTNNEK